ncbi:MAG: glycine cleavage system protein GcvH [Actinomycetota bacterium]|nr:glycine cleavage system protein GcvH [Actinomycetota bacterium]
MTSQVPPGLLYSAEHLWVHREGDRVRLGITDFAQASLGELVFARISPVGTAVAAGESVGEVESLKSTSDLCAPLSGTVARVNPLLEERPELVNGDPYGEGWLCELDVADADLSAAALVSAEEYRSQIGGKDA